MNRELDWSPDSIGRTDESGSRQGAGVILPANACRTSLVQSANSGTTRGGEWR